ncbi:peptidase T [Gudongella oleilytica]|mgnify:FL=1|jgi:tripeptide aminopeptidase|uniref:peptidase T n=1 Tax=Gudongella oleilytica TaxID=1582259 RepID=UPI000ECEECE1|nr:peptidase T [Gudongella oleilytica]MDY0256325.1 peptidase T [Gudongella oleilytica]HCO18897.1 peptidase T [Tissierellales bacterium]
MDKIMDRFLEYVRIETTSDESSTSVPSSAGQLALGKHIADELKSMGLEKVNIDHNGYLTAVLPANTDADIPVIGFIAHMDTSPDISGKNVSPRVVEKYDGGDILLDPAEGIVLSPRDFPELSQLIGKTLITTDGSTLLGADNKAGIAEIITAIEYLINNPGIPHGEMRIAFTPDEEIGRGADHFDVDAFGADWAYTVDGGPVGELEFENFNAASAKIVISGRNVHPGTAKNKMINSIHIAHELGAMLPVNQRPEFTEGYEGFFHLMRVDGTVERTELSYIIRDHSLEEFNNKKSILQEAVNYINKKYGQVAELTLKDSYFNMREKIEPVYDIIKLAEKAMTRLGIEPKIKPIRGGTDGSRLSFMGLPCPNLFTGGYNFHGKYEFITIEGMKLAALTIVEIAKLAAEEQ